MLLRILKLMYLNKINKVVKQTLQNNNKKITRKVNQLLYGLQTTVNLLILNKLVLKSKLSIIHPCKMNLLTS